MGFISSLFGGNTGMGWQAQGTNIMPTVSQGDVSSANAGANNALAQQQAFLASLQRQNGVGNQSTVFNQMQGTANQLQGVANGTGPNPALAQLNQTTGQNVAGTQAAMAGVRGASNNAGLIARQAGMAGMNAQQQAVGQAATMSAQQQLAALQALQGQQAQMAGVAGTQVGQQANAVTGLNSAAQGIQGNVLNAAGNLNNANVGMQSNINNANAGVQGQVVGAQKGVMGGLLGGIGSALGLNQGGRVPGYAMGGPVQAPAGPSSFAGKFLSGAADAFNSGSQQDPLEKGMQSFVGGLGAFLSRGARVPGQPSVPGDSKKNDTVPAMLSPGEVVIKRTAAHDPKAAAAFLNHLMGWHLKA